MQVTAAPDHPAFAGHFPGRPLLPGVVLLDWAWQAARAGLPAGTALAGLSAAKFLHPVQPGDTVAFEIGAATPAAGSDGRGAVDFTARLAPQGPVVAQGRFTLARQ